MRFLSLRCHFADCVVVKHEIDCSHVWEYIYVYDVAVYAVYHNILSVEYYFLQALVYQNIWGKNLIESEMINLSIYKYLLKIS